MSRITDSLRAWVLLALIVAPLSHVYAQNNATAIGPVTSTGSGGGGSGTVTSVSVTTANGVSGSVANPTTTPAISLTLGAITPSTVAIGAGAAITSSGAGGVMTALAFTSPGAGVATALGVNVGSPGAFVVFNGALGTPSSGTLTSATGLPISTGVSGLGTGVATALGNTAGGAGGFALVGTNPYNLTGPITSVGNATSIASQTGTGTTFAMSASPTFTGTVGTAALTATGNVTISSASLITSGNLSAAAWTVNGLRNQMAAASFTDTSSSGTVANAYTDLFGVSTILASSATTYTNYYGAFFKAPVASTNVTFTNKSALGADTISIGGAAQSTFALAVTGTASISGAVAGGTYTSTGGVTLSNLGTLQWTGRGILTSSGAGAVQHGGVDTDTNASIVAQTIRSQGALAGGTSDQAGKDLTYIASPGKGTGAGGSHVFQTAPGGSTGTTVNAPVTALTLNSAQTAIFAGTADATSTSTGAMQIAGGMSVTKRTFMAGLTASAGLQTAVICLSSANELIADSVACLASSETFKEEIRPSDMGLATIMALQPITYRYQLTGNDKFDAAPNQRAIHAGLGAKQVEAVDPRLVAYDVDGNVRTVRQEGVISALIAAVQELNSEIEMLKTK